MSNSRRVWRLAVVAFAAMCASPQPTLADPPEPMTSIDKEWIRRVIRAHLSEVRYCYERALDRDPDVEGRVVIRFVVAPSGEVESSKVDTNTTGDVRLGECIAKTSESWKFPESPGLEPIVIVYPFLLQRW